MSLTLLVGNIGCGKSFFARRLARQINAVIVNMDKIIEITSYHGYGHYSKDFGSVYRSMEMCAIHNALTNKLPVIIDRTCMTREVRHRYIDAAKSNDVPVYAYDYGSGDRQQLMRRMKYDKNIPHSTWEKVWTTFYDSYECPDKDEGINEIFTPPDKYEFHAFDFDGTVVKNKFPKRGPVIEETIAKMKTLSDDLKNIIIIWSCRSGNLENEMRQFLIDAKIPFDLINDNPIFETGGRKIFAHYYYDDRNSEIEAI